MDRCVLRLEEAEEGGAVPCASSVSTLPLSFAKRKLLNTETVSAARERGPEGPAPPDSLNLMVFSAGNYTC